MSDITVAKEALELFAANREAVLTMWEFYATGTLAVLGFTVGSDRATHNRTTTHLIQIGYGVFALGNLFVIATSQRELVKMAAAIRGLVGENSAFAPHPTPALAFIVFHVAVSLAVIFGIWCAFKAKHEPAGA